MNLPKYLPWAAALGLLTWAFCPYFSKKEEEEVTSGEESIEAIDKAARRMS